jgi:very-short-patch-repair endonuclease
MNEPGFKGQPSLAQTPAARDLEMVKLAEGQWAIVDLDELRALGIDKWAASRREHRGRLHRLHIGVYSIIPPLLLRPEGRWLAAVKAAGPDALLFADAAAANWDMRTPLSGPVHVAVPSGSGRRRRSGLIVHRCATLQSDETTIHRGIPCTTPARTLQDMKKRVSAARFDSLLRRAEKRGLDTGGIWGVEDLDATRFERRLLALCKRHGLPRPRTQQVIGPYTVDFLWPEAGLVVETDDFGTHGTRSGFESDRARDAWLLTQSYRVVRFTWRQLEDDPVTVVRTLRRLLRIAA